MTHTKFACAITHALLLAALVAAPVHADGPSLQAQYQQLADALATSPFQRPLVLQSVEQDDALNGDIFAVVTHPFDVVSTALQPPQNWCEILILHLNIKHCVISGAEAAPVLSVRVGRKTGETAEEAHAVDFAYSVGAASADYLQISMSAPDGPMGTRNYRIVVEAVPVAAGRSFLHLAYAYEYGMAAKLAMKSYLGTLGRGKFGFTETGRSADGQANYVDGVRGVVERNTMRYYLAVDTYLDSLSLPPESRTEQRLRAWFAATERFAAQLHELEEAEYLETKHAEMRVQQEGELAAEAPTAPLTGAPYPR